MKLGLASTSRPALAPRGEPPESEVRQKPTPDEAAPRKKERNTALAAKRTGKKRPGASFPASTKTRKTRGSAEEVRELAEGFVDLLLRLSAIDGVVAHDIGPIINVMVRRIDEMRLWPEEHRRPELIAKHRLHLVEMILARLLP